MTTADWILLAVIGAFALLGLRRGFVGGFLDLVGLMCGLTAALVALPWLDDRLSGIGLERRWVLLGVGLTIFVAVSLAALLLGRLIAMPWRAAKHVPPVGLVDALGGLLPGAAKGALLAALLILGLVLEFPNASITRDARSSPIGRALLLGGAIGLEAGMEGIDDGFRGWTKEEVGPGQEFVTTSGSVIDDAQPSPELEQTALRLINSARDQAGLPDLDRDGVLNSTAREHATAAATRTNGRTPESATDVADRLAREGRPALAVGAVLGTGDSVEDVVAQMLQTPEYRGIVLSPTYRTAGFGVIQGEGVIILVGVLVL